MALPREATDDSDAESAYTAQEDSNHASIELQHESSRGEEGHDAGNSEPNDELDAMSLQEQQTFSSSYWSVAERREFDELLHRFGSDFEAIAKSMKTKTTIMVSKERTLPSLLGRP